MFEPSTPGPRIMPDCLESNQCYVRSYVGGGEIPDLSRETPLCLPIQFTPLMPHSSLASCQHAPTHICQNDDERKDEKKS